LTQVGVRETKTGGAKHAMSRSLTLAMDPFGSEAFAEFAERQGASVSRVATLAARYYLADSEDRQPAWRIPSSARRVERERPHAGVRVEVDDATWNALLHEARRQGVDICVLAAHAVLYFMADVDSGRVAQRMADVVADRRRR
jgi:hypothetical protein